MKNRKGLSDVVTVVLIILLALAAVVIVANFILPFIRGTGGELSAATACLDITVEPTACSVASGVTIKLVSAGDTPTADIKLKALVKQTATVITGTVAAPSVGATAIVTFGAGTVASGNTVTATAVIADGSTDGYTCAPALQVVTCGA